MNRLEVEGTKEGRYYQMALDQTLSLIHICLVNLFRCLPYSILNYEKRKQLFYILL